MKQAFVARTKCEQLLSPHVKCYQKIINHLKMVDKWIALLTENALSELHYIPLRKEQTVMFRCNRRIVEVIRLITIGHPNRTEYQNRSHHSYRSQKDQLTISNMDPRI